MNQHYCVFVAGQCIWCKQPDVIDSWTPRDAYQKGFFAGVEAGRKLGAEDLALVQSGIDLDQSLASLAEKCKHTSVNGVTLRCMNCNQMMMRGSVNGLYVPKK